MEIFADPKAMQAHALAARGQGKTIALAPTMGALHEGHRALMRAARPKADILAVSIFVNPAQFGPNEDFQRYPRTREADLRACGEEKVDWVFAPKPADMYPDNSSGVWVLVEDLSERLCGKSRPGHFRGVATVVLKLLNICQPTVAVFGWKDAQQFLILRRMAAALNMPVEMTGVDTVREPDGLAMSSRNAYLSPDERRQAPALCQALRLAAEAAQNRRAKTGADLVQIARGHIEQHTSSRIDYVEAVSMNDLAPADAIEPGSTLLAVAACFGQTRLIDNVRL